MRLSLRIAPSVLRHIRPVKSAIQQCVNSRGGSTVLLAGVLVIGLVGVVVIGDIAAAIGARHAGVPPIAVS
jgi:hypothetical protein